MSCNLFSAESDFISLDNLEVSIKAATDKLLYVNCQMEGHDKVNSNEGKHKKVTIK